MRLLHRFSHLVRGSPRNGISRPVPSLRSACICTSSSLACSWPQFGSEQGFELNRSSQRLVAASHWPLSRLNEAPSQSESTPSSSLAQWVCQHRVPLIVLFFTSSLLDIIAMQQITSFESRVIFIHHNPPMSTLRIHFSTPRASISRPRSQVEVEEGFCPC